MRRFLVMVLLIGTSAWGVSQLRSSFTKPTTAETESAYIPLEVENGTATTDSTETPNDAEAIVVSFEEEQEEDGSVEPENYMASVAAYSAPYVPSQHKSTPQPYKKSIQKSSNTRNINIEIAPEPVVAAVTTTVPETTVITTAPTETVTVSPKMQEVSRQDAYPVQIYVTEWQLSLMQDHVPAGPVTFSVTNTGQLSHELALWPQKGIGVIPPKQTRAFTLNLEPGTYKINSARHTNQPDMSQSFTVK